MTGVRRLFVVLVLASVALVSAVSWTHVHLVDGPGLYDARCPSYEFAHHPSGLPLSSPDAAPLDPTPVIVLQTAGPQVIQDLPAAASPRAPPVG
jgi:hypothetical protein